MILYLLTPLILIFSSSLGLIINPSWSISPFIWVFLLVPIIDLFLPYLSKDDLELKESVFHNFSILIVLPCILFLIIFGLIVVSNPSINLLTAASLGAAVGMSGGSIGITTAHELIHRKNKFMRGIGILLLVLCCYGHFRIEHIYGHHLNVATKEDPATARKGENFYFYFIRCVLNSLNSAWNIEKNILDRKKLNTFSFSKQNDPLFFIRIFIFIIFLFNCWNKWFSFRYLSFFCINYLIGVSKLYSTLWIRKKKRNEGMKDLQIYIPGTAVIYLLIFQLLTRDYTLNIIKVLQNLILFYLKKKSDRDAC